MSITYLKKATKTSSSDDSKTREIVENILKDIEKKKRARMYRVNKKIR